MRNPGALLDNHGEEPEDSGRMSFLDHLEELRKRIIHAVIGLGVAAVVAMAFTERLFNFVVEPARRLLPAGGYFIYTRVGEGFAIRVELVLIAATILAAPWILLQVWLFIAPGLYQREKRFAIPFVVLTSAGCLSGAAFNHYVAFRAMMQFFAEFSTDAVRLTPTAESVFDMYVGMAAGMMLVFQMPTIAFFLARMGVVSAHFLLRHFKYAVLIAFVVAAIVTPSPDPWDQSVLAATMIGLYVVCIAIAAVFGQNKRSSDVAGLLLVAAVPAWGARILPFDRSWRGPLRSARRA
jgi:sec-independent protein translocase protein TatC